MQVKKFTIYECMSTLALLPPENLQFLKADFSFNVTSKELNISPITLFFFYKNTFYKNIEAEICEI